ncbi:MAG: serine hydrolase [Bacteroidales bacterium]|nr:serine hydrolase [Bacteroidales bacterium]
MNYKNIVLVLIVFILNSSFINIEQKTKRNKPAFINKSVWVDSVFNSLTPDERIAQLFMIAAYSNKGDIHKNKISELIKKYKIGGLIFFQGGPVRQANLTNYYQSISKTPLLIGIDAEWGLGMRLDSTISFPRQMMLGAIQNDSLIYELGEEIAKQSKRLGIHINFAPVIDVNNNPENPVINVRSFGEDKKNVAEKGIMYMTGMQDNCIIATAKHFPGHGDTKSDSHYSLPIINHSKKRFENIELYPFKHLIKNGIGGIMIAHLYIPAYDKTDNRASTLSPKIVSGLLKKKMGFKGLIITDALNMKGVSQYYKPGELEVLALLAGNDILLFPEDVPIAIKKIKESIKSGLLTQEDIDNKCKKILKAKKWVGLDNYSPVKIENIDNDINNLIAELLKLKLIENSLTLLKNENDIIPFKRLDTLKIASVVIGEKNKNSFQEHLDLYAGIKHFNINKDTSPDEFLSLKDSLDDYNLIIVGIHNSNNRPSKNFGITRQTIDFVDKLSEKKKVLLDIFANPYSLSKFSGLNKIMAILMSYEDNKTTQRLSAQLLFGGISALGKLPVTASDDFPVNTGIIKKKARLKYSIPQEVGADFEKLKKIDSLAINAIKSGATPGCQIFCAKDGIVFYNKSFGYHTYDSIVPVKNTDVYDLASITKIVSTVASLMNLYDEQIFDTEIRMSDYLCYLDTTDKIDVLVKEALSHQSKLRPWIPFYLNTIINDTLRKDLYSKFYSDTFSVQVADSLYIISKYKDSIYQSIIDTNLCEEGGYKYSDLGYYFFHEIIEEITETPLDKYVDSCFYKPMGTTKMKYNPLRSIKKIDIVPTQNDTYFRKQLIHGYVHDPGAALLGGVAGHAGVFSNANDLGKMMQLFLQKGEYGGKRYFRKNTIEYFTSCPYCNEENRKGIGFDKPEMDYSKEGPTFHGISSLSFGHTGFTGTYAWADPDKNIVYVFLSNRIYPEQENNKLVEMNVRTEIFEAFYNAFDFTKDTIF